MKIQKVEEAIEIGKVGLCGVRMGVCGFVFRRIRDVDLFFPSMSTSLRFQ